LEIRKRINKPNYYAFGSPMPGRNYTSSSYRYGFNGMLKDDEIKGSGNSYDYGMRMYDPRLGRFLSVDPLATSFSFNSPYSYAQNDVIRCIDIDGLEKFEKTGNNSLLITIVYGIISDPSSKHKPLPQETNYKEIEADIKAAYTSGKTTLSAADAKDLGFGDGSTEVVINVEFNVSVADAGDGKDFFNKAKPENYILSYVGGGKEGVPAYQLGNTVVYNKDVYSAENTKGKDGSMISKDATKYYNDTQEKIGNKPITATTTGKITAHEIAHKITGQAEEEGGSGLLQYEQNDIQINDYDRKNIINENFYKIKKQIVPKE